MESIFTIIENYGWSSILLVAIIGGMFLGMKYLNNKMDENKFDTMDGIKEIATTITNTIATQNESLVNNISEQQAKLIDFIIKDKSSSTEEHQDMLRERMELTEEIKDKLKDIMNIHNAQRVFIVEFHNSYQNLSGIPFAKYSCTYEWFDKGLEPIQNKCLGIPFSSMSSIVKGILSESNHILIYKDMEKMEHDNPALCDILRNQKTIGFIYSGMFDNKNQLIGCLCIEYQNEIPENIQINNILLETAELTQVINLRYKYQKSK